MISSTRIPNSIESEHDPKNDDVILAQPVVKKTVTPLIPSTEAPDVVMTTLLMYFI